MAKKTKKGAALIAEELRDVRTHMAQLRRLDRTLTTALLTQLRQEGSKEAGNYKVQSVSVWKVAVEEIALPFALQRGLTKIDTALVKEVFRRDKDLRFKDPAEYGFEIVEQERIAPIGGTYDDLE